MPNHIQNFKRPDQTTTSVGVVNLRLQCLDINLKTLPQKVKNFSVFVTTLVLTAEAIRIFSGKATCVQPEMQLRYQVCYQIYFVIFSKLR